MTLIPIDSLAAGVIFSTDQFGAPTAGKPVSPGVGLLCNVYLHNTVTPATVFTDETGLTPLTMPVATADDGSVPGWVNSTALPLDLAVTLATGTKTFVLGATGLSVADGDARYLQAASAATADLDMGGHKVINLGDAASATDANNRESGDARYPTRDEGPRATDSRYGCVADAAKFSSISVTGTAITFGGANLTTSQVGKTILIEGAGTAGDAFVTTLLSRTNSTTGVLTTAVTTNVSGVNAYVGTDNKIGLKQLALDCIQGSSDGLVKAGTQGKIPPGNYLTTEFWSDQAISNALQASQKGAHLYGSGQGTVSSTGSGATQIWYAGTGAAVSLQHASGLYNFNFGQFVLKLLRPIGVGTTTWAIYLENLNHSTVEEIQIIGQQNNVAHTNQGSGFCWTNMATGLDILRKVHVRDFQSTTSEGFTIGEWDTALNTHGDCGGVHIDTCICQGCTQLFHFRTGGGSWESCLIDNCKALSPPFSVTGTNAGFLLDAGVQGCTFAGCHTESAYYGIKFNGCTGNVILGGQYAYQQATTVGGAAAAGDGSTAFQFVSGASGNVVQGGTPAGWTGGSPGAPSGTPGFDLIVAYDATSNNNIVKTGFLAGFTVVGTAFVSDAGLGNVTKNYNAVASTAPNTGTPYVWTPLVERAGFLSGTAATTYLLGTYGATTVVAVNQAATGEAVFYIDPTLCQPGSRILLQARVLTNAVAPAANFNVALWPVATWGGASGALPTVATVGASVANSNVITPAATSETMQKTGTVAIPAAGWYVMGFIVNTTIATGAQEVLQATLFVGQPT